MSSIVLLECLYAFEVKLVILYTIFICEGNFLNTNYLYSLRRAVIGRKRLELK